MKNLIVVLASLAAGCAWPCIGCNGAVKPTPVVVGDMGLPVCPMGVAPPPQANACDGKITAHEMGCFKCAVTTGCVLQDAVVWCVPSCADCGK